MKKNFRSATKPVSARGRKTYRKNHRPTMLHLEVEENINQAHHLTITTVAQLNQLPCSEQVATTSAPPAATASSSNKISRGYRHPKGSHTIPGRETPQQAFSKAASCPRKKKNSWKISNWTVQLAQLLTSTSVALIGMPGQINAQGTSD